MCLHHQATSFEEGNPLSKMKVLILGLPRTGTQSLADALIQLRISPVYHMREVGVNNHQEFWIRAIEDHIPAFLPSEQKKISTTPWTREQWETILAPYEAVSDFPPALFPTALAAAYPDCPIILSTRSFESWAASMRDTLVHGFVNRDREKRSPMEGLAAAYHSACWGDDFERNGRGYWERHHAGVRALGEGGRRFLEFCPGDGWGPLCEFLGVDVPEGVPFPRSDDWVEYKKKVERERREGKVE